MKITSKFLTADVKLTRLSLRGGRVEMSGLVKGFMPIEIEAGPEDVRHVLSLFRAELPALRKRARGFVVDRFHAWRGVRGPQDTHGPTTSGFDSDPTR
jgi:hypothetical protein